MLAVLFYGTSLFAQDKPFDIEHAPAPLFRCPIHDGPTDPTLEWNEERQEWWMFYTQRRANVPNLQEVACVYGSKVGIAATKNNGKNWYYVGTANLPEPMQGQSTFWAPDVFKHEDTYYMIVTFIPGIHPFWGGDARLVFYKSKDLMNWDLVEEIEGTHGCIDASAFQMPDGTWKMWYKTPDSKTNTGVSKDLTTWKVTGKCEIDDVPHEGPVVFYWKNKYWNIIDECNLGYVGLHCYESDDATNWTYNSTILNKPGLRPDDFDQGRHCDVVVTVLLSSTSPTRDEHTRWTVSKWKKTLGTIIVPLSRLPSWNMWMERLSATGISMQRKSRRLLRERKSKGRIRKI